MRCVSQPVFPWLSSLCCWEIWGDFCQRHPECHKSWSWWTWQAQSCLQSSTVSSADSSSCRYIAKMRKCSFMQPVTLWTDEHILPLLYHDNPVTTASGCTADRNITLPDSQRVLHLEFLALRNCSWINCFQFPIRQTGNRSSVLWTTAG